MTHDKICVVLQKNNQSMTAQEIAKDILTLGLAKANNSIENVETGILTGQLINPLEKQQVIDVSLETEFILRSMIDQMNEGTNGSCPSDYECGILFQYVFDKVTEVTYKTIIGKEVDTEFNVKEAFEYHEPDLPYYIQQKLTDKVVKLACLCGTLIQYMDRKEYRENELMVWMLPFLMVSSTIAIQFAQEMELNSDIYEYDNSFSEEELENHECLIVLNEIAKKALYTLGEEETDSAMVNLMGAILCGINSGESDELIAVKAKAELLLSSYALDEESIKEMSKNTREKCQKHLFALQIAIGTIQDYHCSADVALSQIANMI